MDGDISMLDEEISTLIQAILFSQRRESELEGTSPYHVARRFLREKSRQKDSERLAELLSSGPHESSFTFDDLDLTVNSVRVLTILPGKDQDPIVCALQQVPLEHNHHCLSYEWGPKEKARTWVYVNGRGRLPITPNLWLFLHTARRYKFTEPIWIDAICIKQNDIAEKNHQVRLMGSIFEKAYAVIVWLGLDDIQASSLASVSEEVKFPLTNLIKYNLDGDEDEIDSARSYASRRKTESNLLKTIRESSYWGRTWIVQEVILARRLYMITPTKMVDLNVMLEREFKRTQHSKLVTGRSARVQLLRMLSSGAIRDSLYFEPSEDRFPLQQLLELTKDRACSQAVDRIYSVLYLAKGGDGIRIDYNIAFNDLVSDLIDVEIRYAETLDLAVSSAKANVSLAAQCLNKHLIWLLIDWVTDEVPKRWGREHNT